MQDHLSFEKPLIEHLTCSEANIALYGMGNGAEKIIKALQNYGLNIKCVFASDEFVKNKIFKGYPIISYQTAVNEFSPLLILMAFGSDKSRVIQIIKDISVTKELYFPDVEVCGDSLFTAELYKNMFEGLKSVYKMLADDLSRKVFDCLLLYKISGKLSYLFDAETSVEEAYCNVLKLTDNEVYVDCGAYNGDTIKLFIQSTGGYSHIYALEPDTYNFNRLNKNCREFAHITLFQAVSNSFDGKVNFNIKKGRQSAIDKNGEKSVKSVKIDSISPDATFIKLDVEGNEYNSIKGCEEVIRNNRPKLQIAAYHRHKDLLLPLEVYKIRKDYKVYLRHMPCIPAWDTNYYFV